MNIPRRNWRVSPSFKHSLLPAYFAYEVAKQHAKHNGLQWKVKVTIRHSARTGNWYGHAYGGNRRTRGRGQVVLCMNGTIAPQVHHDHRYKDQPGYYLYGAQEVLCFLAGHEFSHILGYDGTKVGEMAANKFGFECVLKFREREYQTPECLI